MNGERCPGCGGGLVDGKCTIGCEDMGELAKEALRGTISVEDLNTIRKSIDPAFAARQVEERLNRLIDRLEEFFPQLSGKIRNV